MKLTLTSAHVHDGDLGIINPSRYDGNGGIWTETSNDGSYVFDNLPLGNYTVIANKDDHEFETPIQTTEVTLDAPNQLSVDFVDLSVYPVGGLISATPYDLKLTDPQGNPFLVPDVEVIASPIGPSNTIKSTPSESAPDATNRNYTLPLFGGKYVFGTEELAVHDIRLNSDIPGYEPVNPENPMAGGTVTITGPTDKIHFTDYAKRTLTIFVEDSGGFPIQVVPDLPAGHDLEGVPIYSTVSHAKGSATAKVTENGAKKTVIEFELPPGEYTVMVGKDFYGQGIGFRETQASEDEETELKPQMDVDLTLEDREVTMVVPVPIQLEFAPRPHLLDDGSTEFHKFKEFLMRSPDDELPRLGMTEKQFAQLRWTILR